MYYLIKLNPLMFRAKNFIILMVLFAAIKHIMFFSFYFYNFIDAADIYIIIGNRLFISNR